MQKSKVIGFNAAKLAEQMMANAVAEQNRRLIAYAEKEIKVLGDKINSYASANHMDRTGHLLNSLCWIVSYDNKTVSSGFYREAKLNSYVNRWGQERGMGTQGGTSSYLHEWFYNDKENVNGRQLAEEFLKSFKGASHKWKVAFAVLAPYWGYWESGFNMKGGGGIDVYGNMVTPKFSGGFRRFQVMTHIYDDVRMALKPAETHLTVYVPKYIYKSQKWKKKLKNRKGIKKIGLDR